MSAQPVLPRVPPEFWGRLCAAPARLLLLDYDGTLAPFVAERDQAVPYPGVRELLGEIQVAGHTRLVVISGRYTEDLMRLLALDPLPELWGSHGLEQRLPDGAYRVGALGPEVEATLKAAADWAAARRYEQHLEHKPGCLAFHWRGLPEPEICRLQRDVGSAWEQFVCAGLELRPFDGGLELRPGSVNKGSAVNEVLRAAGSDTITAYLGDDLTDEDAFAALAGRGLGVLVRREPRPTAAEAWIQPPEGLLDFLRSWHAAAMGARVP
jgi:trehalose 6-phosphate phosphatase